MNINNKQAGVMGRMVVMLFSAVLITASCTEKIDLKLKDTGQHVVIQGNITDQPGPYTVYIYKSLAYYQMDSFPPVTDATVIISDNAGNSDTLVEAENGVYNTTTIQGTPGRSYYLQVLTGGVEYGAVSNMPNPVEIDTLTSETATIFGQTRIVLFCKFTDAASETNFYRITTYQNEPINVVDRVYSDEFSNGNLQSTIVSTSNSVERGDSILVLLQAIDKPVYTYFSSLRANTSSQAAAPANPISNLSNNALGYFSAQTVRAKLVVVP